LRNLGLQSRLAYRYDCGSRHRRVARLPFSRASRHSCQPDAGAAQRMTVGPLSAADQVQAHDWANPLRTADPYSTFTPSRAVRALYESLSRRVNGPTSPLPIFRSSTLTTLASSPIVPVQNISSAA